MLVVSFDAPVSGLEAPLGEADLVKEDQLAAFCLSPFQSANTFPPFVIEGPQDVLRLVLLLADLLSLDAVLLVESSEWRDSYALIGKYPVEEHRPSLERQPRPLGQCFLTA